MVGKIDIRVLRHKIALFGSILALLLAALPTPASAAALTHRVITLSNSAGNASGVSYTLTTDALPTTGTAVQSVDVQFCDALSAGVCSGTLSGFDSSSSTLATQPSGLGAASGWTVSAATQRHLRISNSSNSTNPSGSVSIQWNGVHNPTANNSTFYAIITTYSGSDWSTGPLDTGNVALSTSAAIEVDLNVSEALTFCAGTSITGQDCSTVSGATVTLGDGSTTATSSGTSVFAASTNAAHGYTVTVNGNTLTSGSDTITAMSGAASSVGTSQYGLNLKDNTTPNVGAEVSGTGTAAAQSGYNTADSYKFVTGETVASVAAPTNANAFTVSYIANIAGVTKPGAYKSNLNYIATANF